MTIALNLGVISQNPLRGGSFFLPGQKTIKPTITRTDGGMLSGYGAEAEEVGSTSLETQPKLVRGVNRFRRGDLLEREM